MTADRSESEVLALAAAQADARRARAEASPVDPSSVSDLLRERLGRQVAKSAERRGQLNVGGVA